MRRALILISLSAFMLTALACQPHSAPPAPAPAEAAIGPKFEVRGGVARPGDWPLACGETVSQAARAAVPVSSGRYPMTIMLMRRGPEGSTRHVIDLNAQGAAVDASKDIQLTDGDQLVFPTPSGQSPRSTTEPAMGYR